MHSSRRVVVVLLFVLISACGDGERAGRASDAIASEPSKVSGSPSGVCNSRYARGLIDAFDGREGFAGLYLEANGQQALVLHTKVADLDAILESARRLLKPVTQAVYDADGNAKVLAMSEAELVPRLVEHSLLELVEAEERLCRQVVERELEAEVRIDYLLNRLVVAGDVAVSVDDDRFVERRPYRRAEARSNIRDYRRPVVAGAQSLHAAMNQSTETCTIGFVASFAGTRRYITASHCTPQLYSVPGIFPPEFRQNGWTAFDGVGTEVLDPAQNCGTKCRRTDASASSVAVPSQSIFGSVLVPTQLSGLANPACSNNGSCTETIIGNTLPWQAGSTLLPGATIERIGRTSGRVFGRFTGVSTTPITLNSSRYGSYRVGSHARVTVATGVTWTTGANLAVPGDSGGPVGRWTGSGFIPDGILFASRPGILPVEEPDYQFSTLSDLVTDLGSFTVR